MILSAKFDEKKFNNFSIIIYFDILLFRNDYFE